MSESISQINQIEWVSAQPIKTNEQMHDAILCVERTGMKTKSVKAKSE